MSLPEVVKKNSKVIAIVVRKNIKVKEVEFFSPKNYPFQIGFHDRPKNTYLKPHLHPLKNFYIKSAQEVLYVLEGKIKIDLYDEKKKLVGHKTLNSGDSILFVSGGHGIKFIKKSRVFEVKQGPFFGDKKAKTYI